jgi:hypothetical protein
MKNSPKKSVLYTCITNNYDQIPISKPKGNFDFICFLDEETFIRNEDLIKKTTEVEYRKVPILSSPQEANRFLKIRPDLFFNDYDKSIYIDGNVRVIRDPFEIFDEICLDQPVALYLQPDRNCAYRELDELVRGGIAKGCNATRLKSSMKSLGMKNNNGLFEANIIFRLHNDPSCKVLMEIWWSLWDAAIVKRDQPLLAFANHLTGNKIIHSLGYSHLRACNNLFFYYEGRIHIKTRFPRLIRRIVSELTLYRRG